MTKLYIVVLLVTGNILFACKPTYCQKTDSAQKIDDELKIDFVGNGDIQKAISQGTQLQANTGLGIIFFRRLKKTHEFESFEFDFVINVASTSDSINANIDNGELRNRREFGSYVINPTNSKQATIFNFQAYLAEESDPEHHPVFRWIRRNLAVISGVQARFIASNLVWTYDSKSVNLAGFLIRLGLFHDFVPSEIRNNKKYSIIIGANYTYRGILGDIRSSENDEFRKKIVGTTRTRFNGVEFNLALRFMNIRAEVQIPIINYRDNVSGLTHTQFITSIRFVGGFPLKLN